LDIFRVYCRISATGDYQLLTPVDPDSQEGLTSFYSGQNLTGIPSRYDKTGNGILLDAIPSFSSSDGLKMSINREGYYFTYTDTTRVPGFYGLYHAYFYLKPALEYARRNNLTNERKLKEAVMELEEKIKDRTSQRSRDEKQQIITKHRSPR
jgi:hypothetical protein